MDHKDITYNPLQTETIKYQSVDCNLVIAAPTSSGKTIVAEQFIAQTIMEGKRALYLSPLKALTNEKLVAWENLGIPIVAITSDHMNRPRPITEKLILMTTEALDSRSRGAKSWLQDVGVIVCDEAHLLGVPKRGDAFEIGLTRFSSINPSARIVFLSATMPNVQELKEWLTSLNGKETVIVETDWRPITQEHFLVKTPNPEWKFSGMVNATITKLISENPSSQILIFVHSIYKGHQIAKQFNIPFHYSKVSKEARHEIEEAFRNKVIKIMVSTSTLAWGVNLPADIGIIIGGHRGPMMVDAWDIKQMAGRIGRYGLATSGRIYYIFKDFYANSLWKELHDLPPIESQLKQRLYFHIVSFIAREGMQYDSMVEFIQRTLCYKQTKLSLDEALEMLMQYEIVYKDGQGLLRVNSIGRASALMYVDPIDLYYLSRSLRGSPLSSELIAKAFADIPSNEFETYVPDDLHHPIQMQFGAQTVFASALYEWLEGMDLSPTATSIIPPFVADIERLISALSICGIDKSYLNDLHLHIVNGVQRNLLELVSLKGIGRKYALALSKQNIFTKKDILEKKQVAFNVLGKSLMQKVLDQIENAGKIILRY